MSRLLLLGMLALASLAFAAATSWSALDELSAVQQDLTAEAGQVLELQKHVELLERKRQSLEGNGFESERIVRERLGMCLLGEKVMFYKQPQPR